MSMPPCDWCGEGPDCPRHEPETLEGLYHEIREMMLADCNNRHVRKFMPFPCCCRELADDLLDRYRDAWAAHLGNRE